MLFKEDLRWKRYYWQPPYTMRLEKDRYSLTVTETEGYWELQVGPASVKTQSGSSTGTMTKEQRCTLCQMVFPDPQSLNLHQGFHH